MTSLRSAVDRRSASVSIRFAALALAAGALVACTGRGLYDRDGGRAPVTPRNDAAAVATCTDRVRNGAETGVDCGGGTCPACGNGGGCLVDADCGGGLPCTNGTCQAPTCTDGARNG